MNPLSVVELVVLLVVANGTPFLTHLLFGRRLDRPLDGNLELPDGHPLLGPSKTIRGLLSAVIMTALTGPLFDLTPMQGAAFGMLAMLGDLASSFTKRRLGIRPSHSAPLLDQLPEALLPLLVMQPALSASTTEILAATAVFFLSSLLISRLREKRHRRAALRQDRRDAGDGG